jgi:hypothetical protein
LSEIAIDWADEKSFKVLVNRINFEIKVIDKEIMKL